MNVVNLDTLLRSAVHAVDHEAWEVEGGAVLVMVTAAGMLLYSHDFI